MTDRKMEDVVALLQSRRLNSLDKQAMKEDLARQISQRQPVPSQPSKGFWQRSWAPLLPFGAAFAFAGIVLGGVLQYTYRPANPPLGTPPLSTTNNGTMNKDAVHLPNVAFENHVTSWHGFAVGPYPQESEAFEITAPYSPETPLSPSFMSTLSNRLTKPESLTVARTTASFPIREPAALQNWTRIYSHGARFPITQMVGDKFVGYKYTPTYYFDIYKNASGEKLAVTQTTNSLLSEEARLLKKGNPPSWVKLSHPSLRFHKGSQVLQGFGDNFAYLYQDKTDSMKELTVYHQEPNGSLSILKVVGTASPSMLAYVAKTYLAAPTH